MAEVAWFENALGSFVPARAVAPPAIATDTARFSRHRTIFISDTHLGTRGCKAEALADFLAQDALVALNHDGEPISTEHGGPARLIVPRLYAWKSAKWLSGIELVAKDQAGFWEANGYHMRGDPWAEERYGW